jgi:hypothetical protein
MLTIVLIMLTDASFIDIDGIGRVMSEDSSVAINLILMSSGTSPRVLF